MAQAAAKPIEGEYIKPDAEVAIRIYRQSIAPRKEHIAEKRGEMKEPWQNIKDQANFPKPVLELLMKVNDLEDAKRDHWLLAFHEGMKELKLFLPSDLVTQAQGLGPTGSPVPTGERSKPRLVTLSDGSESDLGDAGEEVAAAMLGDASNVAEASVQ